MTLPEPWGYPSPLYNYETGTYDNGGIVWHGDEVPTKSDYAALVEHTSIHVQVDWPTCFGGESFFERNVGKGDYQQTVILG